jgi:hypothetical protein
MTRYRSRAGLSLATGALFFAALAGQPFHTSSSVNAQGNGQTGTTSARAIHQEISRDNGEALDKEMVEADPNAPDDSLDSAAAEAAIPKKAFPIPIPLPGGLDYAANGVATRNTGSGTIRLRGIPPGAVRVRALLSWASIFDGFAIPLTQTITFNGTPVTGNLIGVTNPPCWPGNFLSAYTASVIALLTPGLNGDYRVANMPTSLTDGRDPWLHAPVPAPRPLSEGASLVVIYSHASVPFTARVFTHPVVQQFSSTLTVTHALGLPLPAYTTLKHTRLGADGQVGSSTTAFLFATNEQTFLGPNAAALTQIKGPGSPFNNNSDWNGDDGIPLNQLWDTQTSSFGQLIPPGSVAYTVSYISNGDCLVPVQHVLGTK